ncbi:DUF6718 family protein [Clostridium sp.]|nr:DUF6718 family protein [Clostridium sp.]MDR3596075.1 hypothetical protein [Clostridium sp.]
MYYLIAKKFNEEGSLVLEAEQGQRLASISSSSVMFILIKWDII